MRIGILALALIFVLSGVKNIQDSGIVKGRQKVPVKPAAGKGDERETTEANAHEKEQAAFSRRKLWFGMLLSFVGLLVVIYYFITL